MYEKILEMRYEKSIIIRIEQCFLNLGPYVSRKHGPTPNQPCINLYRCGRHLYKSLKNQSTVRNKRILFIIYVLQCALFIVNIQEKN